MATKTLKIGTKMPSFELRGTDGKMYNSGSFNDKKLLVIIFSCNHCPYVQAYEDRIIAIQNDYKNKSVAVAAINSNNDLHYEEDSFQNMVKRYGEKNFNFPYLRDETQEIAKKFDASHTPEIFVFNDKRELSYHGKIDDNWKEPEAVKSKYLRDALDELLAGKDVSVRETFSIGCTIKWKRD